MIKSLSNPSTLSIYIIAILLVITPFIGIQNIAFIDYPNHLARYHILENQVNSKFLQEFYTIKGGFYPYWGMESFMRLFTPILGVQTTGRIFVIMSLITPVIGTLLISQTVNKKISTMVLVAPVFIFSAIASWGFVNFLYTLGFAMCAFALWIKLENAPWKLRLPLFSIIGLILCSMHMISVGFLGLFIGFWELYPIVKTRKITKDDIIKYTLIGLIFIPAGLFILSQSADDFGGKDTFYGSIYYRIESTQSLFNFMGDINNKSRPISFIIGLLIISILMFMRKRDVKGEDKETRGKHTYFTFHPRLIFVGIIFLILSLIVPFAISGVAYINIRFPLIGIFLIIAALKDINLRRPLWLSLIIIGLVATKLSWTHLQLSQGNQEIKALREASKIIPKGSRILPIATGLKPGQENTISLPPVHYTHHVAWLTIERDALFPYFFSMFNVGTHTAYERQTSPHDFAVDYKNLDTPKIREYAKYWREDFDYILFMHFGTDITPPQDTRTVHKDSWFDILEINPVSN